MIKRLLLIFLILASNNLLAKQQAQCTFSTFETILHSQNTNTNNIILNSNCPDDIKFNIAKTLLQFDGLVTGHYLNSVFQKEFKDYKINLVPSKVNVMALDMFLQDKLNLNKGLKVFNSKSVNGRALVTNNSNKIKVFCTDCQRAGDNQVKIVINNQNYWITTTLKRKTKTLSFTKNKSVNNESLQKDDFVVKYIYTTNPQKYYTNVKHLSFYKLNKEKNIYSVLLVRDLTAINLITAGRPAQIIFKHNNLKIFDTATPFTSGKLGQIITLKKQGNNKKIVGKIINYNKVLVEL